MFSSRKTAAPSSGGYNLTKSLRFRSSASASLSRTFGTPTNNLKWTYSGWIKRGAIGSGVSATMLGSALGGASTYFMALYNGDALDFAQITGGTVVGRLTSTALYRDPAAWYHVVLVWDSANATAANRMLMYVNGVQVTSFSTNTNPSSSLACSFNQAGTNVIGYRNYASDNYFDGYLAEQNFIDGQALTPSSFGSTNALTGVWQPTKYTGTYGNNGFYLPFTNITSTSTLGNDSSGNGNNWTTNNFSLTAGSTYDSMTDVPTLTSATTANYAVINPLWNSSNTNGTINDGNLKVTPAGSNLYCNSASSIAMPLSGYSYVEFTCLSNGGASNNNMIGIIPSTSTALSNTSYYGSTSNTYGYLDGGSVRNNSSTTQTVASYTTGDVISVAYGNGKLWFAKNGVWQGSGSPNPATATSPFYSGLTNDMFVGLTTYSSPSGATWGVNFGQQPFTYTPPTGYVALNTYNL